MSSSIVRAMSPHSGTSTGWNLPRIMRSRSTWIVGTQVGIDVWLENEAPSTSRQSAWATVWLATGMPERPSTPQPSGWSSGKVPLALKVEITGASRCSASAITASRCGTGAVADDDGRPLGGAEQLDRRGPARRPAGRCAVAAIRPGPRTRRRVVEAGELLHVVGQHEVGDVALDDGVLHGEGGELGGVVRATGSSGPTRRRRRTPSRAAAPGTCPDRSPGSAPGRSGRGPGCGRPSRPRARSGGWWRPGRRWRSRRPGCPVSLA